jgi:hypothetical protein
MMTESVHTLVPNSPMADGPAANHTTGRRAAIVGAAGGLLVLAAVGWVLKQADIGAASGDAAQPTVAFVAKADLGAAATTLTPSAAGALIEDAERCRIPLISLTIERGSSAIGDTIRIRSGSYVSPYFTITAAAQRIAVPFPSPFGSGSGSLVIEGNATGAAISLSPAKVMAGLPDAQSIPVVWRATSPC